MVALYSLAVFLGAALLFLVQPLFTKLLLPVLGGAPSVWTTAQLFFQAMLLGGYGLAHLSTTRLSLRRQVFVQLALLLLALLLLPLHLPHAERWGISTQSPVAWLLFAMLTTVGLPFLVLSATGPLLQRWFSSSAHPRARDPYFLYAAGNLGSLLGLIAYPTLIEPRIGLTAQSAAWTGLFVTLLLLLSLLAALLWRKAPEPLRVAEAQEEGAPPIPARRILRWIALSAVPSALTLATTTALTTNIASAPLFWIIPLSIYLLTFILAYLPRPIPRRPVLLVTPLVIILGIIAAAIPLGRPLWLVVALALLVLFVIALAAHGELALDRPRPSQLTAYYFWISLGGVLGSASTALLAPILLRSALEQGILLVLAAFLLPALAPRDTAPRARDISIALGAVGACAVAIFLRRRGVLGDIPGNAMGFALPMLFGLRASSRRIRLGLSFAALLAVGYNNQLLSQGVIYQDRSFFGALKITESQSPLAGLLALPDAASQAPLRSLYHGITLHGVQSTSPLDRGEPLGYYSRESPMGQLFQSGVVGGRARVAVVGLGVGALLAYATPEQRWTIYEIDPLVAKIAEDPRYFTYLSLARAPTKMVLGDARRSLSVTGERYSLIILDAYSADTVPIHLLTREAFQVYLDHLEDGGIIAAHISNRHVDLGPVIAGVAHGLGLFSQEQNLTVNASAMARGKMPSRWALLARKREDLGAALEDPRWSEVSPGERVEWTDELSSVWPLLRGL